MVLLNYTILLNMKLCFNTHISYDVWMTTGTFCNTHTSNNDKITHYQD